MNHRAIIKTTTAALGSLDRILARLHGLRDALQDSVEAYEDARDVGPKQEVDLLSKLLLAEELMPSLEATWGAAERRASSSLGPPSGRTLRFSIDGPWRAHEFAGALGAVNRTYQLFAVRHAAMDRVRRRPGSSFTRADIYENAHLFYYLHGAEELRISKVRYASPGEIEVLSQLAAQVPEVIEGTWWVLLFATLFPRLCRELPSLRRHWVEENTRVHDKREARERASILHKLFMERARECISESDPATAERAERGAEEMIEALRTVGESEAVDPVELTLKQFKALSTIARHSEHQKLNLVGQSPDEPIG